MSAVIKTPLALEPNQFKSFLDRRVEPKWLTERRKASWQQFELMDWPSRKSEEWMRSDLRGFHLDKYAVLENPVDFKPVSEHSCPIRLLEDVDVGGRIVGFDGRLMHTSLDQDIANQGVIFESLESASVNHSDLVQKYLFSTIDSTLDRFASLEAAAWSSGGFLHVPKNTTVTKPLHVFAGMSDGGCDVSHLLVVLEEDAEATVLYECSSVTKTSSGFHCGGLELIVKPGARLRFVKLQEWGDRVWHFSHQRATVDRDATLQWTIAAMGARFSQVNQQVSLVGAGATSQVNGTMFTSGKQQMTFNTIQYHLAPHCRSDFLYKAALQDSSRTVWRGMIKVAPGAMKTDGYQRNDNLMLSDLARADSIPGLEIKADDVRCTHGSTSGKVDEELIFYAQSRGFTRHEAVRMIVTGFFQQIFDRITIESVRKALGSAIARQVRQYD